MIIPKRVYLSGGGVCVIAHIGALKELSNHIPLTSVKEWMGVSAGALVAMCLCIGFSLDELEDFCMRFDFTNIREYDSIPGWLLHFGIDTGERLHKLIDACLHVKGLSSDITFRECQQKFKRNLRVTATDLNDGCSIIFSPDNTPDYKISNAVRASMSYPYYFQPFICPESGHYLSDGGLISNYPLFILPKEEHNKTLSILIRTGIKSEETLDCCDLEKMIARPIHIIFSERTNNEAKLYNSHCINIHLGEVNILEFSFDDNTKNDIILKGKEAVTNFFKSYPKPKRRYSVG